MAKAKKPDPAILLAERMLEMLELARPGGIRRRCVSSDTEELGELCDGAPSPDLIVKAATKKAFTDKAVVTEKVAKKPSLDSPVYFKAEVPERWNSWSGGCWRSWSICAVWVVGLSATSSEAGRTQRVKAANTQVLTAAGH